MPERQWTSIDHADEASRLLTSTGIGSSPVLLDLVQSHALTALALIAVSRDRESIAKMRDA